MVTLTNDQSFKCIQLTAPGTIKSTTESVISKIARSDVTTLQYDQVGTIKKIAETTLKLKMISHRCFYTSYTGIS